MKILLLGASFRKRCDHFPDEKKACIHHKADSPVTSLPTAPRRGGPSWRICPVGWNGPPFVRRRVASLGRTLGHEAAARGGGGRFKVEGASDWRSGALLGPKGTRLRSRPNTSSECQARQPVTNQATLHQQWASKSGSGRKRQWMTAARAEVTLDRRYLSDRGGFGKRWWKDKNSLFGWMGARWGLSV